MGKTGTNSEFYRVLKKIKGPPKLTPNQQAAVERAIWDLKISVALERSSRKLDGVVVAKFE